MPNFRHDTCSAVHPLAVASPYLHTLRLERFGLEWLQPETPLAHPFDDGSAATLERSLDRTVEGLGIDGPAYQLMLEPLLRHWQDLLEDVLGPLPLPPRHPLVDARFGWLGVQPAERLARRHFRTLAGRGLFAGLACHSILPLERPVSAAFGLMLAILGHAVGWPIPRGGAQSIANALGACFQGLGGEIVTGWQVKSLAELPPARGVLFDVTPRQLLSIAGERFPPGYRRQLLRYRYGPGVFKLDWALAEPIPWKTAAAHQAGTLHLGGGLDEIAAAERQVWHGDHPERPFVLLAQQSLFDSIRAPKGQQTAWAYCHVPNGSTLDMTDRIESQVERFAPGFRDCILARSVRSAQAMQAYNPNYIGGDINGGVQDLRQLFTRPSLSLRPYRTGIKGIYLCSSSTPPGGGVHGQCGYHAVQALLEDVKEI